MSHCQIAVEVPLFAIRPKFKFIFDTCHLQRINSPRQLVGGRITLKFEASTSSSLIIIMVPKSHNQSSGFCPHPHFFTTLVHISGLLSKVCNPCTLHLYTNYMCTVRCTARHDRPSFIHNDPVSKVTASVPALSGHRQKLTAKLGRISVHRRQHMATILSSGWFDN